MQTWSSCVHSTQRSHVELIFSPYISFCQCCLQLQAFFCTRNFKKKKKTKTKHFQTWQLLNPDPYQKPHTFYLQQRYILFLLSTEHVNHITTLQIISNIAWTLKEIKLQEIERKKNQRKELSGVFFTAFFSPTSLKSFNFWVSTLILW